MVRMSVYKEGNFISFLKNIFALIVYWQPLIRREKSICMLEDSPWRCIYTHLLIYQVKYAIQNKELC